MNDNLKLGLLGAVVALAGICLAAAHLVAHLVGAAKPTGSLGSLIRLLHSSPADAYGTNLPTGLYWATVAAMIALLVVACVLVYSRFATPVTPGSDPTRLAGLADAAIIREHYSAKAIRRNQKVLRPSLSQVNPKSSLPVTELALLVGTALRKQIWIAIENSLLVIAPPRQGKSTSIVWPAIVEFPGAVVSTSMRAENAVATAKYRAAKGPVVVFDPAGATAGTELGASTLVWALSTGCEDPSVASLRARALAVNGGSGVENGSFWTAKAEQAIAPMLHAAALSGGGTDALFLWASSPAQARKAVKILESDPRAARGWDVSLDAVVSGDDPRTVSNMWAQVENALLLPLRTPAIRAAVTSAGHNELNVEQALRSSATIYVIAGESGASSGIVAALIEDIYATAYRLANRSPGNRLDPPLLQALDEVANIATLPSLPQMISAGGGAGIMTMAVIQSLSQAKDRWGADAANAIWGASSTKVIMGGLTESQDLQGISSLLGERTERKTQQSYQDTGGQSQSISDHDRVVMTPAQIREVPKGRALIVAGSIKAVGVELIPFWERSYPNPAPTNTPAHLLADGGHR